MATKEFRLSGSGGQGVILAGIILAEAATKAGFHVIQTQSYGPEARGGSSRAEVIVSEEQIDYPKVQQPDILLALTTEALEKYCHDIKADGFIVIDESVSAGNCDSALRLPILNTARELGREIVANMVALGVLAGLIKTVEKKYLEEAINNRVPLGTWELNINAFRKGCAMIESLQLEVVGAHIPGKTAE